MRTGYKVSDLMTASPIKTDFDATVKECAELMTKHDIGSILIMKGTKLAGIITDDDIIRKAVVKDLIPSKLNAKDLMTPAKDIVSIEPDKDIYDALVLMKEMEVKRLPVMTKDKLQGLITFKDIMRIQPDLFDVIFDKFELREEKRKLHFLDQD